MPKRCCNSWVLAVLTFSSSPLPPNRSARPNRTKTTHNPQTSNPKMAGACGLTKKTRLEPVLAGLAGCTLDEDSPSALAIPPHMWVEALNLVALLFGRGGMGNQESPV